ncbi:isopeptide-forming domain-containing fimbrial protein [Ohessyouella blattaphilus]|uniref:Isopeptide-forming domain-containing fimbrial protein n=1 Tax=Ohessyouella blattaphilus TaxID=2949333 RepID=A0ABT1EDN4_9FIRM|nr:isopeptide-forming domain-containing fimbrial protein [Ohessyouella blattaphilus]MCP1108748.1 isopeptide-forming domain-containing fimbrial protein [Ohessyouella blattaphilus]MCR8562142.1 isopeptide-forming domain-containing fimbrial protein [Ohessyouella blattaphilus]
MKNELFKKAGLFFCGLILTFLFVLSKEQFVKAEEVTLEVGAAVDYMGYGTNYFYIDGELAYCLESAKGTPANGTYEGHYLDTNHLLAKASYYLLGGPGYEQYLKDTLPKGWEEESLAYCLSHCILSYIYEGESNATGALIGLDSEMSKVVVDYVAYIKSLPAIPRSAIAFDRQDLNFYFSREEGCQRTEVVTVLGDEGNSVTLPVPEELFLVFEGKSERYTGEVKIMPGEKFYLGGDVAYNNGGTFRIDNLTSDLKREWGLFVVVTGAGTQDLGRGHLLEVNSAPVSIGGTFLPQPELLVKKSADRSEKTYRVGDVITYTVEVTQQIEKAVAKNVVIEDKILTPGVKLQKNSIVLLDENFQVIPQVSISVTDNSYKIIPDKDLFLQDVTTGEKYYVEYQVVVISDDLVGKEVKNQVVVTSENTEEVETEEVVVIEKPKEITPSDPPSVTTTVTNTNQNTNQNTAKSVVAGRSSSPKVSVKTGDKTPLILLIQVLLGSCVAIFVCGRIARKSKKG